MDICEVCEAGIARSKTGRPRRFCSNACRQKAYRREAKTRAELYAEANRHIVPEELRSRNRWVRHIGKRPLALTVAIATSTALAVRTEARLAPGATVPVAGYCLRYEGPFTEQAPQRSVEGAQLTLLRADCATEIRPMAPRLNRYPNSAQAVATPDVRPGFVEDVYVSLAGGTADEIVLDVFVFPLMWLLWAGGMITIAGGVWSFAARGRPGREPCGRSRRPRTGIQPADGARAPDPRRNPWLASTR